MNDVFEQPATRRIAFAAVVMVLFAGIVAVATHTGDSGGVGDARLTTKGRAAVTDANGTRREVTGTVALHRGETVEALVSAMTIELPDGSTVEGRPAFKVAENSRVKIAQPVELLAGDLLVTSPHATDIDSGGNRVHLSPAPDGGGAARVARSLAVETGVYLGDATLDSAGQTRTIPALRAMEVSALGRPPLDPKPLAVADNDPWDRRFLGASMDLGATLEKYSSSYTENFGASGATPGFFKQVLPSLANQADFTAALMNAAPHTPGDTLVGGAIAGLSRRSNFVDQWRTTFAFRDAGASWGLVALDQGVASSPLLSELEGALNSSEFAFTEVARNPRSTSTSPSTTGGTAPTTTSPGGGPTTTQPTTPTTPTTPTLPTPPTVPPSGSPLVDGLVDNVNQLLGGLVGGRPPGG